MKSAGLKGEGPSQNGTHKNYLTRKTGQVNLAECDKSRNEDKHGNENEKKRGRQITKWLSTRKPLQILLRKWEEQSRSLRLQHAVNYKDH